MIPDLRGKKLLLIGGIQRTCVIVKRAQELGVHVTVADYYEDSPAKKIADEAVLLDAKDVDALTEYCKNNNIDGVFSAYVDFILPVCKEIGDRIGRPFYATDLMIEMSTDKESFKRNCNDFNVPVPKTYDVNINTYIERANSLPFPVFIKPVDASGSRGADICYDANDFIKKYEHALSFSKKKEITVEDYLDGTEFILDYMIVNGNVYMLSMADRFVCSGRSIAINNPNLMILPSVNLETYYRDVHPNVERMFKELGFKNGVVFLQGYAKNGKITFYEMGCRLGGSWPYIDAHYSGVNPIDLLLSYCLTGTMLTQKSEENRLPFTPFFNGLSAIIYFIADKSQGIISKTVGIDEIQNMKEVVCTIQYYYEGDHFSIGTLTDVLLLAVHIVADDYQSLNQTVEKIYSVVDYLDEKGDSILESVVHLDSVTDNGRVIFFKKKGENK